MSKKVTIVITTWNSLEFLKFCLDALEKYTEVPYKIIILDNGSSDGTKEYIELLKSNDILYLRSEKNLGTIRALKKADKYIDTKFVVLLDSDSIVSPNWLSIFLSICKNNPQVKMIGPVKPSSQLSYPYENGKNSRQIWDEIKYKNEGKSPEKLLEIYCNGKSYEDFVGDFLQLNGKQDRVLTCPPELLSGCCTFLDYDFLKNLGGLTNMAFKKYGTDDVDRCWRVAKAGGLVMRTERVYIHHFEGSSLKENKLNYKPLLYKNNRILLDLWSDEFWGFVRESGMSLLECAKKYWLVREILLSARTDQIPKEFMGGYEKTKEKLVSSV
jgi:GT2 family glycosyltransferase